MKITLIAEPPKECQLILSFKGVKKPAIKDVDYEKLYIERFFYNAQVDNHNDSKRMTEKANMYDFLASTIKINFKGRFKSDSSDYLGRGKLVVSEFFRVRYTLKQLHEYKKISTKAYDKLKAQLDAYNEAMGLDVESCCFCLPI